MRRAAWLSAASALVAALVYTAASSARPAIVVTRDGKEIRGDVTETPDEVKVVVDGTTRTIPRNEVKEIRAAIDVDAEYARRARQLKDNDADGHYGLAEWCRQQERWDLVLAEAKKALAANAKHENAALLARLAVRKLEAAPPENKGKPTTRPEPKKYVTPEDIQKLRIAELRVRGPERVRVNFARGFVERFVEEMSGEPELDTREEQAGFNRLPSPEKLQAVIAISDHKYNDPYRFADQIEIVDDPYVFQTLKTRLMPAILKNCATAACHGGQEGAGGFRLLSDPPTQQALYTNFLMLDSYVGKDGRVIDRDAPDKSLLLEYGLPPDVAEKPHPKTPTTIRPMFRSRRDPAVRLMQDWIASLRIPHPAYGIDLPGVTDRKPPEKKAGPAEPKKEKEAR